jgi:hypothetical protein
LGPGAAGLLAVEVSEYIDTLAPRAALVAIGQARSRLDGLEARVLARRAQAGADERSLTTLVKQTGGVSTSEARKRAKRAKRLQSLPEAVDALAEGHTNTGNVDAVAQVVDLVGADKVRTSPELAQVLDTGDVDHARRSADAAAKALVTNDDLEDQHSRRVAARRVRFSTTPDGLDLLLLEFDPVTGRQARRNIEALADQYYRDDGGRSVPRHLHPRTAEQRLADAAATLLAGVAPLGGSSTERSQPRRRQRPTMVVSVSLDRIEQLQDQGLGGSSAVTGGEPGGLGEPGEVVGVGPIADSVLGRLFCEADLAGAVFGQQGQPLWLGRKVRNASDAQWLALVVRDKHCVLCGADAHRCDAHHLTPFGAPAKGRTDITGLALVCPSCHHDIHDRTQTLYRCEESGQWKLRQAQPQEIPPRRPNSTDRGSSRRPAAATTRKPGRLRPGTDPALPRLFELRRE